MKWTRVLLVCGTAFFWMSTVADHLVAQRPLRYVVSDSITNARVKGDFYGIDETGRRLYGAGRFIIDIDQQRIVDSVADSSAGGGFIIAHDLQHGLTRNGVLFDLRDGSVLKHISLRGDASVYEPKTHRAFVFDDTTTVVDMRNGVILARISTPGAGESAVADGHGYVYFNASDSDKTGVLDAHTYRVIRYSVVLPGHRPAALALDGRRHRLFVGCDSLMVVLNTDLTHVITTIPVESHSDQNAFDPTTGMLFIPTGKGSGITIVHEDAADHFSIIQVMNDERITSYRAILDPSTHRIFSPHTFPNHTFGFEILSPAAMTTDATRR